MIEQCGGVDAIQKHNKYFCLQMKIQNDGVLREVKWGFGRLRQRREQMEKKRP